MALTEEVFKNGDKWYGASSGHEYMKSEVEEKGCCTWAKPSFAAPDAVVLEVELDGQSAPSGNGCGKR
jgi:hypothetical protein